MLGLERLTVEGWGHEMEDRERKVGGRGAGERKHHWSTHPYDHSECH